MNPTGTSKKPSYKSAIIITSLITALAYYLPIFYAYYEYSLTSGTMFAGLIFLITVPISILAFIIGSIILNMLVRRWKIFTKTANPDYYKQIQAAGTTIRALSFALLPLSIFAVAIPLMFGMTDAEWNLWPLIIVSVILTIKIFSSESPFELSTLFSLIVSILTTTISAVAILLDYFERELYQLNHFVFLCLFHGAPIFLAIYLLTKTKDTNNGGKIRAAAAINGIVAVITAIIIIILTLSDKFEYSSSWSF